MINFAALPLENRLNSNEHTSILMHRLITLHSAKNIRQKKQPSTTTFHGRSYDSIAKVPHGIWTTGKKISVRSHTLQKLKTLSIFIYWCALHCIMSTASRIIGRRFESICNAIEFQKQYLESLCHRSWSYIINIHANILNRWKCCCCFFRVHVDKIYEDNRNLLLLLLLFLFFGTLIIHGFCQYCFCFFFSCVFCLIFTIL